MSNAKFEKGSDYYYFFLECQWHRFYHEVRGVREPIHRNILFDMGYRSLQSVKDDYPDYIKMTDEQIKEILDSSDRYIKKYGNE